MEVGGGTPRVPLPDFEDVFETQVVLEGALEAARRGEAVDLSSSVAALRDRI